MEDSWHDVTWKNDGSSLMTDDETQTLVHEIGILLDRTIQMETVMSRMRSDDQCYVIF